MSLLQVKQHTPEWLEVRHGNCTASRVKDAMSFLKKGEKRGGSSEARNKYLVELLTEKLTGYAVEHCVTPPMEWGIEQERYARATYEVVQGVDVDLVGIYSHPTIEGFLASPDGAVGDDGLVEFKCPNSTTHIAWMLAGVVPKEHLPQLEAQLSCSERKWVDFMSFDPRLPRRYQRFIKRHYRDDAEIAKIDAGVVSFLADRDALIARLDSINPEMPLVEQLRKSVEMEGGITDDDIAWAKQHQGS